MIREVVGELFPPGVPQLVRWRLAMFAFCVFVTFHIAWACGLLPGFSGFAAEAQVKAVEDKVDTILKLQIEARLRDLKSEKCRAASEPLKRLLQAEIDNLQHQHKKLDGLVYVLPNCAVIVAAGDGGE